MSSFRIQTDDVLSKLLLVRHTAAPPSLSAAQQASAASLRFSTIPCRQQVSHQRCQVLMPDL
jgi:hypothetical protein